ncbi:MAG: hypothetical protein IT561_20510 [Alphaproteobacteria bacterium]|nr:hypothetical protein [Alphaproteobacteria bacterium]
MDDGRETARIGGEPDTGRLLVIHNPTAGPRRARRLAAALDRLAARGRPLTLRRTSCRGDAETIARAAAADPRIRAIVVAGGDGTIDEAINGIAGGHAVLGILPLGTANVLAHELAIGDRLDTAARILDAGRERAIRLGIVAGRRFAMMAGAGYDAWVVARVDPALKRRLGKGAYVSPACAPSSHGGRGATSSPSTASPSGRARSSAATATSTADGSCWRRRHASTTSCCTSSSSSAARAATWSAISSRWRWDASTASPTCGSCPGGR